MLVDMIQVGNSPNAPWTPTSNWFTYSASSASSAHYHEQDNGLGDSLTLFESGSFANSVDDKSNTTQSVTETGTAASYWFTAQKVSQQTQKMNDSSAVQSLFLDMHSNADESSIKVTNTQINATGVQMGDVQILSNLNINQTTIEHGSDDSYDSSPWGVSTGHGRWSSTQTSQMVGNSAQGTGQKDTSVTSASWGTTTSNGRTTPWGDAVERTDTLPPVNLSWPTSGPPSPPPPPPTPRNTGNALFNLAPVPFDGVDLMTEMEGKYQRDLQYQAMGQTPPPLTAGSAKIYGNGKQSAGEAFADALTLATQMLSTAGGPLSLGFNAAMTLGSVVNGNQDDALTYLSQTYINILECAALLNPCNAAAKALAAYNLTVNGSALLENGVTFKGVLLVLYDLGALFGACFTGDMMLRCQGGKKRADAIGAGDLLWSRDEYDPDGPLVLKHVLRVFERTAKIWHVRVAGQVLRTTVEHPFWVENRQAWLPVGELRVGDVLRTDSGELLPVEGIEDSGKWEKVYNWEIEDYHTYFVSASENAASIWAHNAGEACVGDENAPNSNPYRKAGLPTRRGMFRFIPPRGSTPSNPVKGPGKGFMDKFGNEWKKGPAHHFPEDEFEWDVQLSNGGYLNVSRNGVVG